MLMDASIAFTYTAIMGLEEKIKQTRIKTEKARELVERGLNQREIAKAIGMTQKGVSLMLKRAGISKQDHAITQRKVAAAGAPVRKPRAPGAGRPPAGDHGEHVQHMPSLTVRLPPDTLAGLKSLSAVTGTPTWRLVDQAVRQSLKRVKGATAEDVRRLSKRELVRIKAAHPLAL